MKDNVVDLDVLEKIIIEEKTKNNFLLNDQKIFWAMFYTIPVFHNPTGMTLSPGNLNIAYSRILHTLNCRNQFTILLKKEFRTLLSISFQSIHKFCSFKI